MGGEFEGIKDWLAKQSLSAVGQLAMAALILVAGYWAARVVRNIVKRIMTKAKVEATLVSFIGHLVYIALLTFVAIAALSRLGVDTTSFAAVLAAAGLAVGFALQGSLGNLAGGILLIIFRPFKVADFIEAAGVMGTVEEIQLFTTQLRTPDNKTVIIPNAKLTGDNIINYSAKGTRRVDMVIGASYSADIKKVKEVLEDILAGDSRVLKDPAATVGLLALADSSVNFAVRPWVNSADYWAVYFDTMEAVKRRFDAEGIGIPFPQRDVHIYKHDTD